MRPQILLTCAALACALSHAADPYPLWDTREPIASYAARVKLPAEKSIDLGGGVKLELVLIPAGRFVMGTAEPRAPEITVFSGQVLIGVGVVLALGLIAFLAGRMWRGRRFAFSLRWLMAFCLALSVVAWGGTRWYLALGQIREHEAATARYESALGWEKPGHPVLISKPFYMGKYEVTQEQYEAVTGGNPSRFKAATNPVETVSWEDAAAFCKKLTEKSGTPVALPTEAQWEYACRAGTVTEFNTGADQANFENSSIGPVPVGSYKPNAFGVYDMHGSVWEWCQDLYDENYYKTSPERDPVGPNKGEARVLRGGSWDYNPGNCRSADRDYFTPGNRHNNIGFRACLPLD